MNKSTTWLKWVTGTLWCIPGVIAAWLWVPYMRTPNRYTFSGCVSEPTKYATAMDAITYWIARGTGLVAMFVVLTALSYICFYAITHMIKWLWYSGARLLHATFTRTPKHDMSNNYKYASSDIATYGLTPMSRYELSVDFVRRICYKCVISEPVHIALILLLLAASLASYMAFTMPMICKTSSSLIQLAVTNFMLALVFPTIPALVAFVKFDSSELQHKLKSKFRSKLFHRAMFDYDWFNNKDWNITLAKTIRKVCPNKIFRLVHKTLDHVVDILLFDNCVVVRSMSSKHVVTFCFDWKLLRREDLYNMAVYFAEKLTTKEAAGETHAE